MSESLDQWNRGKPGYLGRKQCRCRIGGGKEPQEETGRMATDEIYYIMSAMARRRFNVMALQLFKVCITYKHLRTYSK